MKALEDSKLGFIILHYQAYEETVNCVESIQMSIDTKNFEIVIVDNASPNKTGEQLLKKYIHELKVHVLVLSENLGFAQGNNHGYNFAKKELKCDFMCITNNDTLFEHRSFFHDIYSTYLKINYAVLGPQIILKNGDINQFPMKLYNIEKYKSDLKKVKLRLGLNKIHLGWLIRLFLKIVSICNRKNESTSDSRMDTFHKDVVLHGCCLIFSPQYISKFDTAFDSRTFLFREEELLYLRLKKNNFLSVYVPSVKVIHLEDAATNMLVNSNREKELFTDYYQIKSTKLLIKEMSS